ncbi:MAG: hypothetical protein IH587_09545 [Anaerolineae bacterium]|nr:hypothetical protein [Anaerolineae bacterium]
MKRHFHLFLLISLLLALSLTPPLAAQDETPFPLAAHGTYVAGIRTLRFSDDARAGREITVSLWYPAIMPADKLDRVPLLQNANMAFPDLLPDMSGAPYSVILYSHGYEGGRDEFSVVIEPLVTHGFVVATVQHVNDTSALTLIDRPLDILYVIDQLEAVNVNGELAGLMTLNSVGLFGVSDGGYTALAMTGARIDEAFMGQWGSGDHDRLDPTDPRNWYADWDWNALKAYYDQFMPPSEDGLLQPMSDPRIGAIVSYLPCYAYIFGERGLAAATVPTLLIAASEDEYCPYATDAVFAYEHLGSPEHFMLTLVNGLHDFSHDEHEPAVIHFINAFFGDYLQGNTAYAEYLTEDFVAQFDQLAWGTYASE